jgi:hypothetical protein
MQQKYVGLRDGLDMFQFQLKSCLSIEELLVNLPTISQTRQDACQNIITPLTTPKTRHKHNHIDRSDQENHWRGGMAISLMYGVVNTR